MNLNIIIFLDNIEKKLKYIALYGGGLYIQQATAG